ncbi:orotidine 5'-phosphate decarboxylase [Modicella reniformis]|uniref:Orotidine 5'-phosphate decarboxylase n=1 Tax=Modicella reniformis TaxID=1440133 RepID=A0A9P6M287_9FUNG|nr:orotidine 5'-phosphate decarboxylase [Modicella reniformis]
MSATKSYGERAKLHSNPTAKAFLELMERKKTNLSLAADLTSKAALIELADKVGPYICLLKTHIDVVEDFDQDLVDQLTALAKKHDFMIFEDRKFADIGNTVKLQYSSGIYKIASWSDITNAHTVPGEGIIRGLRDIGLPLNRCLLLLAEMSSAGTLAKGDYTTTTVELARKYKDFVVGFIAMRRYEDKEGDDFIYMTPGVGLDQTTDGLGQQWKHPEVVVRDLGCDVIIVGRGIYDQGRDPAHEAQRYQEAGWKAYKERIQLSN